MRHSTPFIWQGGRISLNPQFITACQEQGISEALLHEWVDLMFPSGSVKRSVLVARAYDNAYDTDVRLDFPNVVDLPNFNVE